MARASIRTKRLLSNKLRRNIISKIHSAKLSTDSFLARRPHRSFRRTYRRDYVRSLDIPGYWGFTAYVWKIIYADRILFLKLTLAYGVLVALLVGLASQSTYEQLADIIDETSTNLFSDGWASAGKAGLLLLSGVSGSLKPQLTEAQQVYSLIILLMTWLTAVWLIRARLSGKRPRLRDGIYNGGAPIVATGIVLAVLVVQLLPGAIAVIAMNAAIVTGVFNNGFMGMTVSLVTGILILLSLYWAVSSFIALVIVTLPGMYPWQAVRAAGDLVIGRRLRILLRIIWLLLGCALAWTIVIFLVILIDRWLTHVLTWFSSVPIVPLAMAATSSAIVIFSAVYVYLLYRKLVDDDAAPA